jgi:5-(aminomethyl)-3-furanmethanol phosphate kinase
MHAPVVMKVGGSLFDRVPWVTEQLLLRNSPVLLVPGGGPFKEMVQRLSAPDSAAHWMAIAAMEQYGWHIAAHGIPMVDRPVCPTGPTLLLPYCVLRDRDPLPHSWNITSDTIAAWVAATLGLELVLLKSVDGIFCNGVLQESVSQVCTCNEVDPALIPFVLKHRVRTTVLNGRNPDVITAFLDGKAGRGTVIDTRF